jgi:hypothetical protein
MLYFPMGRIMLCRKSAVLTCMIFSGRLFLKNDLRVLVDDFKPSRWRQSARLALFDRIQRPHSR